MTVRAALYLDFDNVFSGLLALDPEAGLRFAQRPYEWLERLRSQYVVDGQRAWLVRRCYINPAGSVPDPQAASAQQRLYFSRYRPNFVRSGFEVVDCPALSHRAKNAADVRMALDAHEAMASGPSRYDEFVVASGDSDLTPLLIRLRAADRRTTILSTSDASAAYTSIADRVIGGLETVDLVRGEDQDEEADSHAEVSDPSSAPALASLDVAPTHDEFRALVSDALETSSGPLNLATLSHKVRATLGTAPKESNWFGAGSFGSALDRLGLPNVRRTQLHLFDTTRHAAPAQAETQTAVQLPGEVERVCLLLDVPRLTQDNWRRACEVLAEYSASHEWDLTEATRWARDSLKATGEPVPRNKLGFIVRGAKLGGAPLDARPGPTAAEVAAAFVRNTLDRAQHAGIELDEAEVQAISRWITGVSEA